MSYFCTPDNNNNLATLLRIWLACLWYKSISAEYYWEISNKNHMNLIQMKEVKRPNTCTSWSKMCSLGENTNPTQKVWMRLAAPKE